MITTRRKRGLKKKAAPVTGAIETYPPVKEGWSGDDTGEWWLFTRWSKEHPNKIQDIHKYLVQIREAKGDAWLTTENVLLLLDAKNPEKAIEHLRTPAAE